MSLVIFSVIKTKPIASCRGQLQTDRQTILVYFAWPTKRPGGHQSQLTVSARKVPPYCSISRNLPISYFSISCLYKMNGWHSLKACWAVTFSKLNMELWNTAVLEWSTYFNLYCIASKFQILLLSGLSLVFTLSQIAFNSAFCYRTVFKANLAFVLDKHQR